MSLINFILKRIITVIPVIFGVILFIFILSRLIPGDPVTAFLLKLDIQDPKTWDEMYDHFFHELWLDRPIHIQFVKYIKDIFTGNWGYSVSILNGQDVWTIIMQRLPRTIDITIFSILISTFLGIKTGIISATHRNKTFDTIVRAFVLLGISIPVFYLGLLCQYYLSVVLDLFPAAGFKTAGYEDPEFITGFRIIDCLITGEFYLIIDYLYHLILPVFCLSFVTIAGITRHSRSSMLEILEQDYIRTARAKGCEEKDVYRNHAFKNSLISTSTILGFNIASLLSGTIFIEITFSLDGIGDLLIKSIFFSDYWVLNATIFVITIFFLIITLVMDTMYFFIDPRIRY